MGHMFPCCSFQEHSGLYWFLSITWSLGFQGLSSRHPKCKRGKGRHICIKNSLNKNNVIVYLLWAVDLYILEKLYQVLTVCNSKCMINSPIWKILILRDLKVQTDSVSHDLGVNKNNKEFIFSLILEEVHEFFFRPIEPLFHHQSW